MNDWYYKNGHKVVGPVSRQELEYLAMIKKVRPSTHVRNGSAGDWRTYKQLRTAATSSQKVVPKSASKAFSVEAVNTETVAAAVSADQPDIVSAVKPDQAGQRRQVSIGVLLGLVVLIAIWLFYDQLPASSVQSQAGNQPTGSDGDNSDTTPVSGSAPSQAESGPSPDMQSTDMPSPGSNSQQQPLSESETQDAVTDNGIAPIGTASGDGEQQPAEMASNDSGDLNDRSAETTSGGKSTKPGDSTSRFTISAPGEATFFGLTASGRRFVFVVDRSGSMEGAPLTRAKTELLKCLQSLPDHVEVLIVFFDDGVLADPAGYRKLGRRSVAKIEQWVASVETAGGTNPNAGMQHAFGQSKIPDAVFLLTDGEIPYDAPQYIRLLNSDGAVRIHTIALVSNAGEAALKQIASENKGDYRFVP